MRGHESPRAKISAVFLMLLSAMLTGCSMPIFAGMTVGEFGFVGSFFSTAATGKGLGEHAMDAATGQDCNILEGLSREDRKICENKGSPALKKDWRGLASLDDVTGTVPEMKRPDTPPRDGNGG